MSATRTESSGAAARPLRLFVACGLPSEARDAVAMWQRRQLASHPEVRVNHALHVTLNFLGDMDPSSVPRLVEALTPISWSACGATFGEVVFLPHRGPRRVIALTIDDPQGGLRTLQSRVSAALVGANLAQPEKRPWLPHVTVARYRRPGQPFPLQNVTIAEFCVVRMALYSSSLESAGAVHSSLAEFPAS